MKRRSRREISLIRSDLSRYATMLATVLAISTASLVVPRSAAAQETPSSPKVEQARECFERGKRYAAQGDHKRAIQEYLIAYKLSKAPKLLYNLGQTYWLSGDRRTALRYFDLYLETEPDGEFSEQVRGLRAALVQELAEQEEQGGGGAQGVEQQAESDLPAREEIPAGGRVADETGPNATGPGEFRPVVPGAKGFGAGLNDAGGQGAVGSRGRVAATVQGIVDYKARGAALQVSASAVLGRWLELRAAGLIGRTMGSYVGAVVYPSGPAPDEPRRLLLTAGFPVFFSDGLRAGVRGSGGMDWRLSSRWSVMVELGAEYMVNPEADRERFVLVPIAGVRRNGF